MEYSLSFPTGTVQYRFNGINDLLELAKPEQSVVITDSILAALYPEIFSLYRTVIIHPGEEHKTQNVIKTITEHLLEFKAHRKTTLVGIGGGVVTDITGYAASVYMRGIPFGFVPTSLLGMVDAAVGGKNGVNFNLQKNLLGTIQQPSFILYDTSLLSTLPEHEWSNAFAEIIKYACIFDAALFNELSQHNLNYYRENKDALLQLIQRCVEWKNKTVLEDEKESGQRKLLNFGHTVGHAIETLYNLPHGQAIALGMLLACDLSTQVNGLSTDVKTQLAQLLEQYKLPTSLRLHTEQLMEILAMDKKRDHDHIGFVLLNEIGSASIKPLPFDTIQKALENF
jgi:3-dehydroquinate synthase